MPLDTAVTQEIMLSTESPGTTEFCASYYNDEVQHLDGIAYVCDFRYEEEAGVGKLRKAITGDDPRRFRMIKSKTPLFTVFNDVNGIIFHTDGRKMPKEMGWADGIVSPWGGEPRFEYMKHIESRLTYRDTEKMSWPGWFHYGDHLVLRADGGVTAEALEYIIKAAKDGYLGVGNGSRVFGSGIFFYDTRDETKEFIKRREAEFDLHDKLMKKLEPVEEMLKKKGHRFYFLGKPRTIDGEIKYWLNGCGTSIHVKTERQYPQPFGWYTLEELKAEKFVDDAIVKEAERKAKYG